MGNDAAMLDKIEKEGGEFDHLCPRTRVGAIPGQEGHPRGTQSGGLGFEARTVEYSQSYILLFDVEQEGRDILVRRDLSTVRHILRTDEPPIHTQRTILGMGVFGSLLLLASCTTQQSVLYVPTKEVDVHPWRVGDVQRWQAHGDHDGPDGAVP